MRRGSLSKEGIIKSKLFFAKLKFLRRAIKTFNELKKYVKKLKFSKGGTINSGVIFKKSSLFHGGIKSEF